jgi:hypothetical protein
LARCSLPSAFCSNFNCISKLRARLIMSTMAATALTLLDSSAPLVTLTASSASAGCPLRIRNRPSPPFCTSAWPGLTSLRRPSTLTAADCP